MYGSGKKRPFSLKKARAGEIISIAKIILAGTLLFIHIYPVSSRGESDSITERALYRPGISRINGIRATCEKGSEEFYSCYIASIKKDGATKEAIAFVKLLGEPGYMREFREAGPVDIAFVNFPFRANENQGCFLVNGNPRMVNVDDLAAITPRMLRNNAEYLKIKEKYPDVTIWIGDRTGTDFIRTVQLKGGGVRFTIPYRLTEGCRACEDVGKAKIGIDFDGSGNLIGRTAFEVRAVKQEERNGK